MPEKIDFPQIIADIEASGRTLYFIAKLMRRQYTQIKRMKNGGTVAHYEGEMLLAIHKEYVKVSRETQITQRNHLLDTVTN